MDLISRVFLLQNFTKKLVNFAKNHDRWVSVNILEAINSDQNNKTIYLHLIGDLKIFKIQLRKFLVND